MKKKSIRFEHILNAGSIAVFECPTTDTIAKTGEAARYPEQLYSTRELKVLALRRTDGDNWIVRVEGLPEQEHVGKNPYISVGWCREILERGDGKQLAPFHDGWLPVRFGDFPFATGGHKGKGEYRVLEPHYLARWMVQNHPALKDRFPHAWDYDFGDMTKQLLAERVIKLFKTDDWYGGYFKADKKRLLQWLKRNQARFIKSEAEVAVDTRAEREREARQYEKDWDSLNDNY